MLLGPTGGSRFFVGATIRGYTDGALRRMGECVMNITETPDTQAACDAVVRCLPSGSPAPLCPPDGGP
jgi:hypothetical protein